MSLPNIYWIDVTTTAQSKGIPRNPFQPFLPFDPATFEPLSWEAATVIIAAAAGVTAAGGPLQQAGFEVSFRGHVSKSIDVLLKIHHVHFVHPKFLGYHQVSPQCLGTSPVPSMAWWLMRSQLHHRLRPWTQQPLPSRAPLRVLPPGMVHFRRLQRKKRPTRNEQHQIHPVNVKLKSTRSLWRVSHFERWRISHWFWRA